MYRYRAQWHALRVVLVSCTTHLRAPECAQHVRWVSIRMRRLSPRALTALPGSTQVLLARAAARTVRLVHTRRLLESQSAMSAGQVGTLRSGHLHVSPVKLVGAMATVTHQRLVLRVGLVSTQTLG